jgi:pimeloyl-ACP methyl ester carboxylesterase
MGAARRARNGPPASLTSERRVKDSLARKKERSYYFAMTTMETVRAGVRRAVIRGASFVAPSAVEQLLLARFFTPTRRGAPGVPDDLGEEWSIRSDREAIEIYSAGSGPRVLFVHGWEGAANDFAAMGAAFRSAGFGTVAFDQPAHGRSSGTRTTLPALARAVLDVARATGPFAAVVGHSLGGSATLLALRDGLPTRCAVLIAPPYDARPFVRELGKQMGATDARIRGAITRLARRADAVGGRATDRAAARLGTPGLVMHDRTDRAVPFSHGVAVAAAWPRARFVPLDGLGHRRALDAPQVHEEILTFVRQSNAGARHAPSVWETTP